MDEAPDGNPVSQDPLASGGQVSVPNVASLPRLTVLEDEIPLFDQPTSPNPFSRNPDRNYSYGGRGRGRGGRSSSTISPIGSERKTHSPLSDGAQSPPHHKNFSLDDSRKELVFEKVSKPLRGYVVIAKLPPMEPPSSGQRGIFFVSLRTLSTSSQNHSPPSCLQPVLSLIAVAPVRTRK